MYLNRNITTGLDRLNASPKIALNGTREIGTFALQSSTRQRGGLLDTSKMFTSLKGGVGST